MHFYRTPSAKQIDRAAAKLGMTETERNAANIYYARERAQNREINIALLKGLWRLALGTLRFFGKVALVLFLLYCVMVGVLAL